MLPQGPIVWLRPGVGVAGYPLLRRNAPRLAVVHPTSFHLSTPEAIDAEPGLRRLSAAAKAANPRVLVVPAVVDDELAQSPLGVEAMRRMLLDYKDGVPGRLMRRHAARLAQLAEPYDGLAVDYEFSFESMRAHSDGIHTGFTLLIRTLRHALPPEKVLAVAVRARTASPHVTPTQAMYDYRRLGQAADLIEVLAYDHAWSTSQPGRIAPDPWVARVARYAHRQLAGTGAQPVLLIGSYGYDWPVDAEGRRTRPGAALTATALTRLPGFSPHDTHWDYVTHGQRRRVYQITASAMRREVRRVASPRGFRVGFWSASESDPAGWSKLTAAL
jgi:hypothetical protein